MIFLNVIIRLRLYFQGFCISLFIFFFKPLNSFLYSLEPLLVERLELVFESFFLDEASVHDSLETASSLSDFVLEGLEIFFELGLLKFYHVFAALVFGVFCHGDCFGGLLEMCWSIGALGAGSATASEHALAAFASECLEVPAPRCLAAAGVQERNLLVVRADVHRCLLGKSPGVLGCLFRDAWPFFLEALVAGVVCFLGCLGYVCAVACQCCCSCWPAVCA